jgi:hypothetical protein
LPDGSHRLRRGVIDAIDQTDRVPAALKAGGEREGMDHAVPGVSRPAGSTEAARTRSKVREANVQEIAAIDSCWSFRGEPS